MKLIIDIDENLYNRIQTTKSVPDLCGTDIVNAITRIQNGKVLPEKDECNEWTSVCTGTCYGRDTFSAEDGRGDKE